MPDGAVGGTFTCVACGAQAWQRDLMDPAAACPHRPPAQTDSPGADPGDTTVTPAQRD
jgi:hypothetical protein